MTVLEVWSLMRGLMFMWIAATAYSVSQLYKDGYTIAKKKSRLINALISLLGLVAVTFAYLSITAFAYAFKLDAHQYIVAAMPIFVFPLGIILTKFRHESITKQNDQK